MDFLMLGLALLLGLWTTGLARSRGRNGHWFWGGAAFILTLLPLLLPVPEQLRLLGMIPLFVLLFLPRSQLKVDAPPKGLACPRCNAAQQSRQRYCVDCGWELGRAYPDMQPGSQAAEQPEDAAEAAPETPPVPADRQPDAEPAAPAPAATHVYAETETPPAPDTSTAAATRETLAAPAAGPGVAATVAASQEVQPPDAPGVSGASNAAPEVAPPDPTLFRGLPTPANMTERGIRLFNLGRIQESIDQYTKAIALDPNYKEAWEYRAEAYARLGRGEQAAEDRRRLQALDTG